MTYCVAISVSDGIVFASDSRTNAGVDYVTTYSKTHVFKVADDRLFVILSAGNLGVTQELLNRIKRDIKANDGRESLLSFQYLFEAAGYVGRLSRTVQMEYQAPLNAVGFSADVSLIFGGQIRGEAPGIFMIYPQGNYITASPETPYLQIGESKYGKPALDRVVNSRLTLEDAARLALVSLDATSRSNISVGPPFEVSIYQRDRLELSHHLSYKISSPYYASLRRSWQDGLRRAFSDLPRFEWEQVPDGGPLPDAPSPATDN